MAHVLLVESWLKIVGGTSGVLPLRLRRAGHRFTLVARNPELYWAAKDAEGGPHPVAALAHRIITADTHDLNALQRALEPYHREYPFDGVVTGCDFYLEAAAQVARHLRLPGNDPSAIHVAYHKHLLRESQRRAGIPTPLFVATSRLEEALDFAGDTGFPLVVKPSDLGGSELVRRVDEPDGLAEAFRAVLASRTNTRGQARVSLALLEEFMHGEEVSVETISYRGKTTVIGITDKTLAGAPAFVETLHMFPARLTERQRAEVEGVALDTLAAIGFVHGIAHTEVKLTPAGARVVEVNPRMAGGHIFELVERTTGLDLFALTVDLALGRPSRDISAPRGSAAVAYLLPPRAGRIDAIDGLERLRQDPVVTGLELRDVIGTTVHAPRDNDDRLGHFLIYDPSPDGARALAEDRLGGLRFRMSDV